MQDKEEFGVNKNNQVIGNRAFELDSKIGRHGKRAYALHVMCRYCGHQYYRPIHSVGRARCEKCDGGSLYPVPKDTTVTLSRIKPGDFPIIPKPEEQKKQAMPTARKNGEDKPQPVAILVRGGQRVPSVGRARESPTEQTEPKAASGVGTETMKDLEPLGENEDRPAWSPSDIFEDDGMVTAQDKIVSRDDLVDACSMMRQFHIDALGVKGAKEWDDVSESTRVHWINMGQELLEFCGVSYETDGENS